MEKYTCVCTTHNSHPMIALHVCLFNKDGGQWRHVMLSHDNFLINCYPMLIYWNLKVSCATVHSALVVALDAEALVSYIPQLGFIHRKELLTIVFYCRPDTSWRQRKAIASMPPGRCLCCPWNATVEMNNFLIGCPLPRRKCLGALALSKTKHTYLFWFAVTPCVCLLAR